MANPQYSELTRHEMMDTKMALYLSKASGESVSIAEFLDLLPVPVAILTKIDGKIVVTNHALEDLLGIGEGTLWGASACSLIPNISERRALRDKFQSERTVRAFSVTNRTCNGRPIWLSVWMERIVYGGKECTLALLLDAADEAHLEKRLCAKIGDLRRQLEAASEYQSVISAEIHDGVVQQTVGALMLLRAAKGAIEKDPAQALEQLNAVERALQQGLTEARQVIESSRPRELDRLGLIPAIEALCDRVSASSGIRIRFESALESVETDPAVARDVYRIVQESLNNIWFHSKATEASVALSTSDGNIDLVVSDDGQGFDFEEVDAGDRRGLKGMRARALMHGGTWKVETAVGLGCVIHTSLPAPQVLQAGDVPAN